MITTDKSPAALFQQTHFIKSAADVPGFPDDLGKEVAFAGRSNVGKSSVINVLCQQKHLAKTSQTPGRTQLINFFGVTDELRLVDLPGYGYAKVAKDTKNKWYHLLEDYFKCRTSLKGIVLIMDIRHPLTEFDQHMVEWTDALQLPLYIILNKSDKLGFGAAKSTLLSVTRKLKNYQHVELQLFSALKHVGIEQLQEKILTI